MRAVRTLLALAALLLAMPASGTAAERPPELSAATAVLVEADTGDVLYQRAAERRKPRRKTYTIKAGDTPSGIAVKVDVPLDQILELNPDLDPQTLTPGTKIKLR